MGPPTPREESPPLSKRPPAGVLTAPQAVFAALVAGDQHTIAEAFQAAFAERVSHLEPAVMRQKAYREFSKRHVRAEIERVAREAAIPDVLLANMARLTIFDCLKPGSGAKPKDRLLAAGLALRVAGQLGPRRLVQQQTNVQVNVARIAAGDMPARTLDDLQRTVSAALSRSAEVAALPGTAVDGAVIESDELDADDV